MGSRSEATPSGLRQIPHRTQPVGATYPPVAEYWSRRRLRSTARSDRRRATARRDRLDRRRRRRRSGQLAGSRRRRGWRRRRGSPCPLPAVSPEEAAVRGPLRGGRQADVDAGLRERPPGEHRTVAGRARRLAALHVLDRAASVGRRAEVVREAPTCATAHASTACALPGSRGEAPRYSSALASTLST